MKHPSPQAASSDPDPDFPKPADAKPAGAVSRAPSQPRSVASQQRMIAAARQFMLERGSEDFTLQEVSHIGKVSIGSIYHRFDSKENLVRAVLAAELARMASAERDMIIATAARSRSLREYVPGYVAAYAEILREHSLMMRLAMKRASFDVEVSGSGEQLELQAADQSTKALMGFRDEIFGNAETKARIAFQVIFATVARRLSLDTQDRVATNQHWDLLIGELSAMTLSYLVSQPLPES
ncbi:TetR/AcrR family transcriptional regulator [Novosphingobium sp.]|uniref:TetR/AcrR family transcriptional regulator n=1 Tax=Novosphingobium sp. TaxID=1874826 RepID=UPI003B52A75C